MPADVVWLRERDLGGVFLAVGARLLTAAPEGGWRWSSGALRGVRSMHDTTIDRLPPGRDLLRMPHMPDTPRLTRIAPIGVLRMIRERPRAGDPLHPAPDARRQTQSAQERGRTLKTKAKAAADRPGQERRAVDGGVDRVAAGRARVWLLASRLGAYRARPRLRRRFSAALSLRGFGRALDPARLPSASIWALSRWPFRGAPAGVAPDVQRDPAEHDDRSDRDDDRRAAGAAAGGRGRRRGGGPVVEGRRRNRWSGSRGLTGQPATADSWRLARAPLRGAPPPSATTASNRGAIRTAHPRPSPPYASGCSIAGVSGAAT